PQIRPMLAGLLVQASLNHLVAIHSEPFRFARRLSSQPRASLIARHMAAQNELVPNLRHRLIPLSPAERLVLQLCDGVVPKEALARKAMHASTKLLSEAADDSRQDVPVFVEQCLTRFLRSALLEA